MRNSAAGFSLMESLICLLVLSIGMLGLGQLQARLWTNAGELQRLEAARLIASNVTELVEINGTFTKQTASTEVSSLLDPPTGFTYRKSTNPYGTSLKSEIKVSWTGPSGENHLTLESSVYTAFESTDARWLLPTTPK